VGVRYDVPLHMPPPSLDAHRCRSRRGHGEVACDWKCAHRAVVALASTSTWLPLAEVPANATRVLRSLVKEVGK